MPGQQFQYDTPDGGKHVVIVPAGCRPGQRFQAVVPIAVPKDYMRQNCRGRAEMIAVAKQYWKAQQQPQHPQQPPQQAPAPVAAAVDPSAPPLGLIEMLPAGWERRMTADGTSFYAHHASQTTQWEPPAVNDC